MPSPLLALILSLGLQSWHVVAFCCRTVRLGENSDFTIFYIEVCKGSIYGVMFGFLHQREPPAIHQKGILTCPSTSPVAQVHGSSPSRSQLKRGTQKLCSSTPVASLVSHSYRCRNTAKYGHMHKSRMCLSREYTGSGYRCIHRLRRAW